MLEEWRASEPGTGPGTEKPVTLPGRPEAFAGADAVRYVTDVDDPRSGDDEVAVLHLDGAFARTEVEVAGSVIGHDGDDPIGHDAYFAPLRIPFRPAEDERIAVTCRAPRDRFGGLFDTNRVPESARVPGVWWDVRLESRPLPYVDDVTVRPEVTDEGARLHVRTTVVADDPLEDRITYSLRPAGELQTRGTMSRGSIETTEPGATTVEHTIEVRDPALWWPRAHGDQHRYTLRAKLGDSETAVTTGIRHVEWDDGDVRINGDPLGIRGVALVTADPADVERAIECNANLVRARAHVLPPAVYEACDEAGVLVWQDLPLTGPGAFDVDRGREVARRVGERRGHHPSLAAVGVHDEPTAAFADGLGSGFLDRLRLRFRSWRTDYDPGDARRVAEALPDRIPTVPVVGDVGTDPDALRLFPGWDYGDADDASALLDRFPTDVVAAFGAGAFSSTRRDVAAGFDRAKHDAKVGGDDVDASQDYQADVVGTVGETLRQRNVGAIAAVLRDSDGGAGMGVYTAEGTPKSARDVLATVYEPLQAFLASPDDAESAVIVCNDSPTPVTGTVRWEAGDETGTIEMTVDAAGRWQGGPVSLPAAASSVALEVTTRGYTVRNEYDRF